MLCSLLNGFLSTRLGAPSFIISLATIGVFHGAALAVTEGVIQTIYGKFGMISNTRLFDVLPLMFLISLLGYGFVQVLLKNTKLGRRVFAIGANRKGAFLSGIAVRLVISGPVATLTCRLFTTITPGFPSETPQTIS